LYFSRELTQSSMQIEAPDALAFTYTQQMMSFLLFVPDPRQVLMLGLGGGSLAKFCYRRLPAARITAVEIDADIIAFRDQFLIPPDDSRLRVVHADAADFLRDQVLPADVVMMDAFDRHGFSASVCSRAFYLDVRDALAPAGLMVANLVGPKAERARHLELIDAVFGGNLIVLPIESEGNFLVFAFRDGAFEPRWRWIEAQGKAMQKHYGLDFPNFARRLKRSRKDGYLQRILLQAGVD
jgi:spermidine synthase